MKNDPDDSNTGQSGEAPYLEIDTGGRRRRAIGLVSYAIFFLAVAGALIALFVYFTNQWTLAILLVGFMVLYMSLMGWMAEG